ncbi:alpha/beta fold hydrolase [Variovorax terrae]|uniref:Alpha/beta fold hydrolase n=1 Tax=Variovorax terrae TaxID=2923278 RepID=A0A9X2AN15_9BURK|nr:alpha/beta fold hydrolase [Variovorax terrae]MCJ0763954.1 alpha/beta fold hydrolase [Variovorax terrae]
MPQLNFVKQGKGSTVVLSHSMGCDLGMWDEVAALLQPRHTVLRYDHRGHGRSEVVPGPCTMEALADDAAALIEQHARGPVTFVGLGMGGMVGQQIAVRYPHLIKSLVLANSASRFGEAASAALLARARGALTLGMAALADEALANWFTPGFLAEPGPAAARVAAARAAFIATDAQAYVASCEALLQADFRRSNPLIACPALVIAGAQDSNISIEMTDTLCRTISGAQLRIIDTGRLSAVERPTDFANLVIEFLNSL